MTIGNLYLIPETTKLALATFYYSLYAIFAGQRITPTHPMVCRGNPLWLPFIAIGNWYLIPETTKPTQATFLRTNSQIDTSNLRVL
ncbi:MAG: hypothetical protein VSS75_005565 [Candidatus Parabeggiatoa sp.]|nr:hypothetical protein [Candidatus Parabeggiatoa sp.]